MNRTWLFTGRAHPALAREVSECTSVPLGQVELGHFPDGELCIQIKEDVRRDQVFLLQPTSSSEAILELLLLADALVRCRPHRLILIAPYFGYGRQERRVGQSPVSAEVMARLLNQSGADRLITLDLHSREISRFITLPHQQLDAADLFAGAILRQAMDTEKIVVVSPDRGGWGRACRLSQALGAGGSPVVLEKRRLSPHRCQIRGAEPEVDLSGRWAILADDIVSTAGTLVQASRWLADRGAHPVWACVTHLVGSPETLARRLAGSPIERLIVSNSLPCPEPPTGSGLQIISLAPLLASVVVDLGRWEKQRHVTSRAWTRIQSLGRRLARAATCVPGWGRKNTARLQAGRRRRAVYDP